MRKRLKSPGNHWKLVWISAFLLCGKPTNAESRRTIQPDSVYCKNGTNAYICDLNGIRGILSALKWDTIPGLVITGASHLTIEPQCNAQSKYLLVQNSQDITSKPLDDERFRDCTFKLDLNNSTAVNLDTLFNQVITRGSYIETIHQKLGQLQILNNSVVVDLSARPHTKVENSEVKVVTEVIIEGSNTLYVADSMIGLLKKLVLNSSSTSDISSSVIHEISSGGIEIRQGKLTMTNIKIDYLPSESIIVYEGELTMTDVNLTNIQKDSIIVNGEATISFENVMIQENAILSFSINTNTDNYIWPLGVASAMSSSLSTGGSIANGFIVGVITVILIIVVVHFSPCCPNLLDSKSGEEKKLQYPLTAITSHPSKTEACPPTPLISDATKHGKDDEPVGIYEHYQDVEHPDINVRGPQTGDKIFPPLPTSRPPPPVQVNIYQGDPYYDDTRNTADNEEEFYDECENIGLPPPPKELLPMNSTFPPPPSHMQPGNAVAYNAGPNPSGAPVREEMSLVGKERAQQQQLQPSNSKPSFLHAVAKPPPPPRVANTSGNPQINNKPSLPNKPVQLPKWPPQSTADQSHFSGSLEDEEDIYEEVP